MKSLSRIALWIFTLALVACAQLAVADQDADRAAIHAAVKGWSAAAQARNAEAFVSVYADDAVLRLEDAPDIRGTEALRAGIQDMMQDT